MPESNDAEFGLLEMETNETLFPMDALTDTGDNQIFTTAASLFSGRVSNDNVDYSAKIYPNGLATGGKVIPGTTDDQVDVAALTCYLAGVLTSVGAAAGESITRAISDAYIINSITVDNAGAIAVVSGTESTAFNETRGAAGGPPYIPIDSIEIAQVRTTSITPGPITADEIFDALGLHKEKWDFPLWDNVPQDGDIKFLSPLPLIHTGDVPKGVFGKVFEPIFSEVSLASVFVPPEDSYTVNSEQVYNATVGSTTKTLAQGTFNVKLKDGVTDSVISQESEKLWFKFFPDRNKSPYILAQGKLGMTRSFPVDSSIAADCTISAGSKATNRAT